VGGITTAAYKSDAYSSVLGTHLTTWQYARFKCRTNRKLGMDRRSLDSAMVYMKKGIEKELCYQRR
jgi:hypothetical protein